MDMSVPVAPDKQAVAGDGRPAAIRSPNASDLDEWLAKVEAMGELRRITAEVDPDLEAATITYLVGSEKSPALLFENIKDYASGRCTKLFVSGLGAPARLALALGFPRNASNRELVLNLKPQKPLVSPFRRACSRSPKTVIE